MFIHTCMHTEIICVLPGQSLKNGCEVCPWFVLTGYTCTVLYFLFCWTNHSVDSPAVAWMFPDMMVQIRVLLWLFLFIIFVFIFDTAVLNVRWLCTNENIILCFIHSLGLYFLMQNWFKVNCWAVYIVSEMNACNWIFPHFHPISCDSSKKSCSYYARYRCCPFKSECLYRHDKREHHRSFQVNIVLARY